MWTGRQARANHGAGAGTVLVLSISGADFGAQEARLERQEKRCRESAAAAGSGRR